MKNVLWLSLFAASAALIAGCHGGESAATPATIQTVEARIVESRQQQVALGLSSTGTVHARESAVVSAQVMGRIQQVLVHEGDSVRAGQTLVVLDDAALRASVEQAQAGVKAAQNAQAAAQTNAALAASTLNRYKQLESEKSVSPQEMDEVSRRAEAAAANLEAVRAQTDAARAQESGARTMMSYTRLVAPFAGVVTARMADPGTMAAPGVPLLQIDQAGALQLQASVDESAIGAIHKGMKVPVAIDGGRHWATWPGPWQRSFLPPIHRVTVFSSKSTCLLRPRCARACMERRCSPMAPSRRSSFHAAPLFRAARFPARTSSIARGSRSFVT